MEEPLSLVEKQIHVDAKILATNTTSSKLIRQLRRVSNAENS